LNQNYGKDDTYYIDDVLDGSKIVTMWIIAFVSYTILCGIMNPSLKMVDDHKFRDDYKKE